MSKLENILNRMEMEAGNFSSYEEAFDSMVENYMAAGLDLESAESYARQRIRKFADSGKVGFGSGMPLPMPQRTKTQPSAQINIVITRNSANVPNTLSIPIFGLQDSMNVYQSLVTPPSGYAFALQGGLYGGLGFVGPNSQYNFYYTNISNTSIWDRTSVSCNEIQYPSLVSATQTDVFRLSKIRYSVNNTTPQGLAQFNNAIKVIKRNMFGRYEQQNLSVQSQKNPNQFQTGIIDLDYTIDIDKETSLVVDVAPLAGLEVTLSAFITKFERRAAGR